MKSGDLTIIHARVVTPTPGLARGGAMGTLHVVEDAQVEVKGGVVVSVSPTSTDARAGGRTIDARGRVLLPGLVDCHTHACWAGDRLDEWEMKLRGAAYLDILRAGGGIMSSVRSTRAAGRAALADLTRQRLDACLAMGTTTIEVKSGYGLTTEAELTMLRAIADAAASWPGRVVPTAMLGHAIDPDEPGFVDRVIGETLPAVHAEFPGIAVDVFIESGAWSLADARRLLEKARHLGHPVRMHADQFNRLGGLALARELGAVSVDHLEASTPEDLAALGSDPAGPVGVALPICGVHVDGRTAGLRPLIDAGGAAAVATNFNPGSAPSGSMWLAMGLAVRHCGLRVPEAITAGTANAAAVLGVPDAGWIGPGASGDLVLLSVTDPRAALHQLGTVPVARVWCAGRAVA